MLRSVKSCEVLQIAVNEPLSGSIRGVFCQFQLPFPQFFGAILMCLQGRAQHTDLVTGDHLHLMKIDRQLMLSVTKRMAPRISERPLLSTGARTRNSGSG